jgi:hypothetical protein
MPNEALAHAAIAQGTMNLIVLFALREVLSAGRITDHCAVSITPFLLGLGGNRQRLGASPRADVLKSPSL